VEPEQPETAEPLTILMVVAHPDDIDFGSGGSVATWTAQGHRVEYCLVTDGDAGGFDEGISRTDMATLRRDEQAAAAEILGVGDLHFLGWPDGRIYVTHELRRDLTRVIRRVRPDRVVTQSPTRNLRSMYGSHPDHTAVGEATMCAVYPDARNPFAHPELYLEEGLAAHTVSEVWITHMGEGADHYVDTTDAFDRKVEALRAHKSQTAHMDDLRGRMWGWGRSQAKAAGFEPERTAEGYVVLDTR
jgi:LmbE family N-acetylglucosaminyl deacetylase